MYIYIYKYICISKEYDISREKQSTSFNGLTDCFIINCYICSTNCSIY